MLLVLNLLVFKQLLKQDNLYKDKKNI